MLPVTVILVRPRFPENIGMAARACANMGVRDLVLVEPERWEYDKAAPLATGKGTTVLANIRLAPSLAAALKDHTAAFGTTARTGGWRMGVMPPRKAASAIMEHCRDAGGEASVALVFGPEDRGLENAETALCTHLVTIPTAPEASSLNLAQAVLLVLYECFTASLEHAYHPDRTPKGKKNSRAATIEEQEMLFRTLEETLTRIEFLPEANGEWFMQPLRRFFRRAVLRRHEFDLFMGICRRIARLTRGNRQE
ncbi:tRNA/rRNA methyltransferase (SpoU) [uncultured delta proteobacterium]|uniref:tRNA/rRNA methyltransferase (SpoU) n=1 Tax=uncultured delta proteobacterium TaxID=34034 RepID=A0A212IZS3_9DELT|nr:tRNA/rRNA methyltransferase (SpoU) [uncultured delta proteobacterium]